MWTLDNPPLKQLKEKYGFEPTPAWLEHIRLASVRVGDGGSGSFVSPNGLVLTNHHVALGQLQKVSTPQKNYVTDGFYAATAAEEIPCPDLELNVLISMENVTAKVLAAVKKGMDPVKALEAKKAAIAEIERQSLKKTGLRSDVVTLYQGGEYWLYRYKKYTDVKLVFAPEQQAAFFGGDPDNFTYPAPRPRHGPLPRLRKRQAGQGRPLPEVERQRRRRRRTGLRLRPPRLDQPPDDPGPAAVPARLLLSPAPQSDEAHARRGQELRRQGPGSRRARPPA